MLRRSSRQASAGLSIGRRWAPSMPRGSPAGRAGTVSPSSRRSGSGCAAITCSRSVRAAATGLLRRSDRPVLDGRAAQPPGTEPPVRAARAHGRAAARGHVGAQSGRAVVLSRDRQCHRCSRAARSWRVSSGDDRQARACGRWRRRSDTSIHAAVRLGASKDYVPAPSAIDAPDDEPTERAGRRSRRWRAWSRSGPSQRSPPSGRRRTTAIPPFEPRRCPRPTSATPPSSSSTGDRSVKPAVRSHAVRRESSLDYDERPSLRRLGAGGQRVVESA